MKNFETKPYVFSALLLLIIIYSREYKFVSAELATNTNGSKNVIEIPYSEVVLLNKISQLEQNRLIRKKLENEGFRCNSSTVSTCNLADEVVDYLMQNENNENKITELATILLGPLGQYGSEKGEEILHAQKISVIHDWLKRSILSMSFSDWILNEVRIIKQEGNHFSMNHGYLKYLFINQLYNKTENGEIRAETEKYYVDNLLKEDMPSFYMKINNDAELERLQLINLSEPEFGYLHVGLKVLQESRVSVEETWSLDDVEDIGVLIESLIRGGNISNIELFELPSKIYYASTLDAKMGLTEMRDPHYDEYFSYLRLNNPFIQLIDPINNWKNRSTLAKLVLKENDVPEDYLSQYLYRGEDSDLLALNSKGKETTLPGIDHIFNEQNKNISDSIRKIDKLMLLQIFNNLNKTDKEFIYASKVIKVQAEFHYKAKYDRWNPYAIYRPEDPIPIFLKLDNINLLQCTTENEERVYFLDMNNYDFRRVDNDRDEISRLYNYNDPGSRYALYFQSLYLIKKNEEPLETLANKLSEIHSDRLYKSLKKIGYEPTLMQKFEDFVLNILVPFYKCITELKSGNSEDAVLPCTIDIISLVPFFGQGLKVAYKFGSATAEVTINALRLAAKQACIHQIILQPGKYLINVGIHQIHKTLNLKVIQSLGYAFLRGVDPGIWLLKLGGVKTFEALKKAGKFIKNAYPKLGQLAEKVEGLAGGLMKRVKKELPSTNFISAEVLETKQSVFLPDIEQEATVVKVGTNRRNDIIVRIDDETNIPFGRKYTCEKQTNSVELAPVVIQEEVIQPLRLRGGGDDSSISELRLSELSVTSTTQKRVNIVYRVDDRHPRLILPFGREAGGFKPRTGTYNYNLDMHDSFFRLDNLNDLGKEETTPFISTFSNLQAAIQYGRNWEWIRDMKIATSLNLNIDNIEKKSTDIVTWVYAVRPNNKFYNVRESYIAARDLSLFESKRYNEINEIVEKYGNNEDYFALGGFNKHRIIKYGPILRSHDISSEINWIENWMYKTDFNNDWSADDLYSFVNIHSNDDIINIADVETAEPKNKYSTLKELLNS